jgi:hypothetical protein
MSLLQDVGVSVAMAGGSVSLPEGEAEQTAMIVRALIDSRDVPRGVGGFTIDVDPKYLAQGNLGPYFDSLIGSCPQDMMDGYQLRRIQFSSAPFASGSDLVLVGLNLSEDMFSFAASRNAGSGTITYDDISGSTISSNTVQEGDVILTAIMSLVDGRDVDTTSGVFDAGILAGTAGGNNFGELRDNYVTSSNTLVYSFSNTAGRARFEEWAVGDVYTNTATDINAGVYTTYPSTDIYNLARASGNTVNHADLSTTNALTGVRADTPSLAIRYGVSTNASLQKTMVRTTYYVLRRPRYSDTFRGGKDGNWSLANTFGRLGITKASGPLGGTYSEFRN